MKRLVALLLVVLTAAPAAAQTPAPQPPPPGTIDGPTLYSHLLYIEKRIDTLETQAQTNQVAVLASQHQIGLQVADVRELIIVEAKKPNIGEAITGLLTDAKFWAFVSSTAAGILLIIQQKSKD